VDLLEKKTMTTPRLKISASGYQGCLFVREAIRRYKVVAVEVAHKQIASDIGDELSEYATRYEGGGEYDLWVLVGWPKLVPTQNKMVVLHDSLLPRYKGHCPVPTALINGDTAVGVTAFLPTDEPDNGKIVGQSGITIHYPIKIKTVYEQLVQCQLSVIEQVLAGTGDSVSSTKWDSYSLWRDGEDYKINWQQSAVAIRRHVDAVGYPYLGAYTVGTNGQKYMITETQEVGDVVIVNRTAGKVFAIRGGCPIVVCGSGLLKLTSCRPQVSNLKTRFIS